MIASLDQYYIDSLMVHTTCNVSSVDSDGHVQTADDETY